MKLCTALIPLAASMSLFVPVSGFSATLAELNALKGTYTLAPLPYAFDALESVVDAETMKIHHGKHHQAYVDNLNKAVSEAKDAKALKAMPLKSLLETISQRGDAIRNNAGGHWNHTFFWSVMTPDAENQKLPARLEKELRSKFGTIEKFKEAFEKKGTSQFGSGWVWLIRNSAGQLEITGTPNQDNPLMDVASVKGTPILGADIWEHAYYLKYQNQRAAYLKSFWKVVNWKQVDQYDQEAHSANR